MDEWTYDSRARDMAVMLTDDGSHAIKHEEYHSSGIIEQRSWINTQIWGYHIIMAINYNNRVNKLDILAENDYSLLRGGAPAIGVTGGVGNGAGGADAVVAGRVGAGIVNDPFVNSLCLPSAANDDIRCAERPLSMFQKI